MYSDTAVKNPRRLELRRSQTARINNSGKTDDMKLTMCRMNNGATLWFWRDSRFAFRYPICTTNVLSNSGSDNNWYSWHASPKFYPCWEWQLSSRFRASSVADVILVQNDGSEPHLSCPSPSPFLSWNMLSTSCPIRWFAVRSVTGNWMFASYKRSPRQLQATNDPRLNSCDAVSYRPIPSLLVVLKLWMPYYPSAVALSAVCWSASVVTQVTRLHVLSGTLLVVDRGDFAAMALLDLSTWLNVVNHSILLQHLPTN